MKNLKNLGKHDELGDQQTRLRVDIRGAQETAIHIGDLRRCAVPKVGMCAKIGRGLTFTKVS